MASKFTFADAKKQIKQLELGPIAGIIIGLIVG